MREHGCYNPIMEQETSVKNRFKRIKRRVLGGVTGAVAAASVAVASLFGTTDELMHVENDDEKRAYAAVAAVGTETTQPTMRIGLKGRCRAFFLRQSAFVRGCVLLPLWGVGRGVLFGVSLLWAAATPFLKVLLGVLLTAALVFALFMAAYKFIFPNRSLKNLFKKRNLIALLIGSLALGVADSVLSVYVQKYKAISLLVKAALALVVLTLLCARVFGKRNGLPLSLKKKVAQRNA